MTLQKVQSHHWSTPEVSWVCYAKKFAEFATPRWNIKLISPIRVKNWAFFELHLVGI
jgi:hypothetical protein